METPQAQGHHSPCTDLSLDDELDITTLPITGSSKRREVASINKEHGEDQAVTDDEQSSTVSDNEKFSTRGNENPSDKDVISYLKDKYIISEF